MKCLCCGKELLENASPQEIASQWHSSCVRKFFGTSALPELDLSEESLLQIATESTNRGFTVPGVQKKLSLHLTTTGGRPRLTLVNYPTGYILKPQTEEYEALPESEYLVMRMAQESGISTVPFALIPLSKDIPQKAYITRRIDRILPTRKNSELQLLAMEDFCQLERRLTENKYQGSYERCAKVISRYSQRPGLDLSELFLRIVFSFIVGNSDMHLKNFSLIETPPGSQRYVLSEAYDLLPVNIILPEDDEQLALTLNGKKHNIHRNDFLKFAETSGIAREAALKMIQKLLSMQDSYLRICEDSDLSSHLKDRFSSLIEERINALRPGN
jgi:serine/threonine-protein kinase HipA